MNVLRFTIIDSNGTVSFVGPGHVIKILAAGCSTKPAPTTLPDLLQAANKYDDSLQAYVLDGLAIYEEHHSQAAAAPVELPAQLQTQLDELLASKAVAGHVADEEAAYAAALGESSGEALPDDNDDITFDELKQFQQRTDAQQLASHPIFRVTDEATRAKSLEPVQAGLVIFNLTAKRIVQVQNTYGTLQRSDRGRYFKDGQPSEQLYFYRLPSEWSLVP